MDYWTDLFCPKNYLYDQDFLTCATVSCFWSISKWYLPHCTEPHNKIRYGWRWCYCYTLSPSYSLCSTRVKVLPWMARYKEEEKSCVQDSSVVWHRFSIVLEIKDHILQNTDYPVSACTFSLISWSSLDCGTMSMTTLLKQQQMLNYYPAYALLFQATKTLIHSYITDTGSLHCICCRKAMSESFYDSCKGQRISL